MVESFRDEDLTSMETVDSLESLARSVEVSPVFDEDFAICVIKPDAFLRREDIIRRLENSGFSIVKRATRQIPERFLAEVMYRDCTPSEIEATGHAFAKGPCEILMIRGGADVVEKVSRLAGLKTNPKDCEPGSIRHEYGSHEAEMLKDGSEFYHNAIHRPKTKEEQANELREFRNLF